MFVHSAYVHWLKSDDCPDRTAHLRVLLKGVAGRQVIDTGLPQMHGQIHLPLGSCCFSIVLLSIPALGSKLKNFTTRPATACRPCVPQAHSIAVAPSPSNASPPLPLPPSALAHKSVGLAERRWNCEERSFGWLTQSALHGKTNQGH